jgi:hypothetical protein
MEIWKKNENYKDYEVSNLGRVKSLKFGKEFILKQSKNKAGYYLVHIKQKKYYVHLLVAEFFLNHKPLRYKNSINHIDFNKSNNTLENLEILTHRENSSYKNYKMTSNFVGVSFNKEHKKWVSKIVLNKKRIFLGYFDNENEAHLAYINKLKS